MIIYRKLTCKDTSFSLSVYNETNCGGSKWKTQTVNTGCSWFTNSSIPTNGTTLQPMSNSTYFEITECGKGEVPWLYVGIGLAAFCCCCCGCAIAGAYCVRKRKSGINAGYVQTYG